MSAREFQGLDLTAQGSADGATIWLKPGDVQSVHESTWTDEQCVLRDEQCEVLTRAGARYALWAARDDVEAWVRRAVVVAGRWRVKNLTRESDIPYSVPEAMAEPIRRAIRLGVDCIASEGAITYYVDPPPDHPKDVISVVSIIYCNGHWHRMPMVSIRRKP